jgi:Concanavalin A-like lectin/glucanases superfamily/Viral BACON domain
MKNQRSNIIVCTLLLLFLSFAMLESASATVPYSNYLKNLSLLADPAENYYHSNPKMTVSNQFVHVLWFAHKKDYSSEALFYIRSTDGGKTFDAAQKLAEGVNSAIFLDTWNNFQADGPYIHLLYREGSYDLVYRRSDDNGVTFTKKIFSTGGYYGYNGVYLTSGAGNVTIAWVRQSDSNGKYYNDLICSNSTDGGATFQHTTIASMSSLSPQYIGEAGVVDFTRSGNYLYILAYTGDTYSGGSGSRLLLYASWDGGATFKPPVRVTVPSANGNPYYTKIQDVNYSPNLYAEGATVNIVWTNNDNPGDYGWTPTLRTCRSTDGGLTLTSPTTIHTYPAGGSGANPGLETITGKGSNLYITTVLSDNPAGTYIWLSTDSGASWSNAQQVMAGGWWPHIGIDPTDSSTIYLTNAWYLQSLDAGKTFTGGVNPQVNFSNWGLPSMSISNDSVVHYCGVKGGSYGHIYYRRIAPEPNSGSINQALSLTTSNESSVTRMDNIQIPAFSNINFSTQMTVEFWVQRTSDNSPYFTVMLAKKRAVNAWGSYEIGAWDNFQIYGRLTTDQKTSSVWMGTGITLPKDTWTHIAMTYDAGLSSNNWKMYVNGKFANQMDVKGAILMEPPSGPLVIGNDRTTNQPGSMKIDELRLWNRPLSESEIAQNMFKTLTGGENGLSAYYNFNDTFKELTGKGFDAMPMYWETFVPSTIPTPVPILSVTPTNQAVAKDAGTTTFSVSNTGTGTMIWSASVTSGSWLSITTGASGTDTGTITCAFDANTGTSARTGTIQVTAAGATGSPVDVTVTQAPTPTTVPVLSVTPSNQAVAKDAGTTMFSVSNTGTGTMIWSASVTSGSWLSITTGASGTDTGTINCSFTANTGTSSRTATIRVTAAGATGSPVDVTVTQAPTLIPTPTPIPVLSVMPTNQAVAKDAGTTTFSVSNTGTGTMPWTAAVTKGGNWLTITSGASGADAGTVACAFDANTSTSARTGTVRVTATGATGSPLDVTVIQSPISTDIEFTPGPSLNHARIDANLATLPDGRVIVFGGHGTGFVSLNTAETWQPGTSAWNTLTMNYTHDWPAFATLADGRFLLAGGAADWGIPQYATSEIYDPQNNTFTAVDDMVRFRCMAGAVTLSCGKVLIAGAWWTHNDAHTYGELFNPVNGTFAATGALNTPRAKPIVLPTNDGKAVVLGGHEISSGTPVMPVELYDPDTNTFSVLQTNLLANDPGWGLPNTHRPVEVQRLSDGRYLLLAWRTVGSVTSYTLVTFNPSNNAIEPFTVAPGLPDNAVFQINPVVNQGSGQAYLLGVVPGSWPYQLRLLTINLATGALTQSANTYTLDPAYAFNGTDMTLLHDGRILVVGGSASSNFDAVANTLLITPLNHSLAVSFASLGLWVYKSDSATWAQLSSVNPENMIYSGSTLYVDFGASHGLYRWDGTAWSQIASANPENMVTSGSTLYVDFGTLGLYKWDGAVWSQLTSINPENMVASGSALYVDLGASYGLYKWDGAAWAQLTSTNPENMVASDSALFVGFGTLGLYRWDGTAWSQLTFANPENMVTSGSVLYVNFGASYGLYKWDGAAWAQLTSINPENMVTSGSTLYVNFGASYGLCKWDGAAWTQLTPTNPENMVASGSVLYVDFGAAYGLYKWDGSSWSQLTGSNPDKMAASN